MAIVWRKRRPETQAPIAKIGLGIMAVGMLLLAVTAFSEISWMVNPALLVFGIGFGLYTFSAFQLLVVMTSDREAGAYLGLWTVTILLSRGVGILLGGAFRDGLIGLDPLTGACLRADFRARGTWLGSLNRALESGQYRQLCPRHRTHPRHESRRYNRRALTDSDSTPLSSGLTVTHRNFPLDHNGDLSAPLFSLPYRHQLHLTLFVN